MQKRFSEIRKVDFDLAAAIKTGKQVADTFVTRQRAAMTPQAAIVNNFDPDQRGFLTGAMQGLVMLQGQFGSTLAAHLDHGIIPPGRTKPLHLLPGTPVLTYQAPAVTPSMNTTFIRGGKVEEERAYPVKYLTRAHVFYIFGDTSDAGLFIYYRPDQCTVTAENYFTPGDNRWDENSPLPPGVRYIEEQDLQWIVFTQFGPPPPGTNVSGLGAPDIFAFIPGLPGDIHDQILPHDSAGNIRRNRKVLPDRAWSHLPEVYEDASYWTGEVRDPVAWLQHDTYWQSKGITKEGLEDYLASYPGARFTRADS